MDKQIAEKILSLTRSHKADMAEVFLRSSVSSSIEVKDQQVDAYDRSRDIGAGLRVIADGRLGFAFTTDLTDNSLAKLAETRHERAEHGTGPVQRASGPAVRKLSAREHL
jgi:predicted Zn-dependent protease